MGVFCRFYDKLTIEVRRSAEQALTIYKFYLITTRSPLYKIKVGTVRRHLPLYCTEFSNLENSTCVSTTNSKTHERVYLIMEKITSFTVNHLKLIPGVYVSRRDIAGDCHITTFDIRMTRPNFEPVMNTAEVHTIEHLGATFLRNHRLYKDKVLYFGPMGCRTGFYLLLAGDYESADIIPLLQEMFLFIRDYEGRSSGCRCPRLRKLPRHEPPDGKISCRKSSMMRYLRISARNSLFIRNNPSPQIF